MAEDPNERIGVRREAPAKLFLKSSAGFGGVPETAFDTTEKACAAAAAASRTGTYQLVQVWSDGYGIIEEADAIALHQQWTTDGGVTPG